MYKYTIQDGWEKAEHIFSAFVGEPLDEELFVKSGFESEPAFCVGTEGRFYVEIYGESENLKNDQYDYLAVIEVGSLAQYVGLPGLPDMMSFVEKYSKNFQGLNVVVDPDEFE